MKKKMITMMQKTVFVTKCMMIPTTLIVSIIMVSWVAAHNSIGALATALIYIVIARMLPKLKTSSESIVESIMTCNFVETSML